MSSFLSPDHWLNKYLGFGAVSLVFFFLNMATFTSLGVVLFTMEAELHWSITSAVFSFTFLGLACGLTSPLPGMTMRHWGGRMTVFIGAVLLAIGFFLASITHSLLMFYVAMTFLGAGYSFSGNVASVYLIAGWFERSAGRMIGTYFMLGAAGAAVGPPVVEAIVRLGGWRHHWQAMTLVSAVIAAICFIFIRDAKAVPAARTAGDLKRALFSPQFLLIAIVMTAIMACVTTNSSVAINHLVKLGDSTQKAAYVLGTMGAIATVFKFGSGWLCEIMKPVTITAVGLFLEGAGMFIFAFADSTFLQYGSALTFGIGWGLGFVGATMVMLDYFGREIGSQLLSFVWFITSAAAAGPVAAGLIADNYGTFAPIFVIYAGMMAMLLIPVFLMRRPAGIATSPIDLSEPELIAKATAI
jgi:MFS family permease